MAQPQPIKFSTLRELAQAGSVRGVSVIGLKGGYAVSIRVGMSERTLAATGTGSPRVFSTIDSVARALRPIGIASFDVDSANYEPGLLRPSRPDSAKRLSKSNEALQHDQWFRSQVKEALEDPDQEFTPHDEVAAELVRFAETLDKSIVGRKKLKDASASKPAAARKAAPRKAAARP